MNEYIEISMAKWIEAFPFANWKIKRTLRRFPWAGKHQSGVPSGEDHRLAKKFCPNLYVEEGFTQISDEYRYIAKCLGIGGHIYPEKFFNAARALLLLCIGEFFQKLSGPMLRLLAKVVYPHELYAQESIEKSDVDFKHYSPPELPRETITRQKHFKRIIEYLFNQILPPVKLENNVIKNPTCVIKYHVCHHPENSNIRCIQYFTYWPIQLFPEHFHDYEPIYVYVKKQRGEFRPLFISLNAVPTKSGLLRAIWHKLRGQHPGHEICTFLNPDCKDEWAFELKHYNLMAEYMKEAFKGKYVYKQVPKDPGGVRAEWERLWDYDSNQLSLQVAGKWEPFIPNTWHAYQFCSRDQNGKITGTRLDTGLEPLKTQDLFQIEWEINNCFLAPFLYPYLGEETALMHLPLDLTTLFDQKKYEDWSHYAIYDFHLKYKIYSDVVQSIHVYRRGILWDLLYNYKLLPSELGKEWADTRLNIWNKVVTNPTWDTWNQTTSNVRTMARQAIQSKAFEEHVPEYEPMWREIDQLETGREQKLELFEEMRRIPPADRAWFLEDLKAQIADGTRFRRAPEPRVAPSLPPSEARKIKRQLEAIPRLDTHQKTLLVEQLSHTEEADRKEVIKQLRKELNTE